MCGRLAAASSGGFNAAADPLRYRARGVRTAYSVAGIGPPLVKTANWLSHREHDWQSPVWRPWLHAIARRYTLILYDERGCGLSDRAVATFSFDDWIADLCWCRTLPVN